MKTKPLEVREIFELTTTVSEELLPQQPESKRKKRRKPRRRREKMKTAHTPEEHRLQMEAQQGECRLGPFLLETFILIQSLYVYYSLLST
jgi:hypothetical protein